MAKYDMESLTNDVKTIITTYLNTKLTEISTEKGDGILTPSLSSSGIYLQDLNVATVNYDPFIVYGIDDIQSEGDGPFTSKRYQIMVVLVKTDQNGEPEFARVMYRYQRALEEIFEEHWTDTEGGVKLIINSLVPRAIPLQNASHQHRACGLILEASLG